jgi:hypothetical protein
MSAFSDWKNDAWKAQHLASEGNSDLCRAVAKAQTPEELAQALETIDGNGSVRDCAVQVFGQNAVDSWRQ